MVRADTCLESFRRLQPALSAAADSCWSARTRHDSETVLPADRLVLEGQPVPVGEPVVFQHSATKQNLNLTNENYFNDFGQETEVSGHTSHSIGKAAVMENMNKGMVKSDLDKPELAGNHWRLCSY